MKIKKIVLLITIIFIVKKIKVLLLLYKKIPKISIFIPIYNNEKYIDNCFHNLLNQTLKDIEIIAINDHSNDNSLKKLTHLTEEDYRIKIINNHKNQGLLYSRAMGILNSNGEYLMNIDSDDEIKGNDTLEYLYNKTQKSTIDIITFNVLNIKKNHVIKCKNENEIQSQPELFNSIFNKNNVIEEYYIWNKLVKREIFLKAYKAFKEEIYNGKWNYFEDDIWSILVNRYAKSKLCINRTVYIYSYNNASLMNNRFNIIEFQNLLYRHEMYKKLFLKKKEEKYLIAEYFFVLKRLKWEMKYILLLNDNNLKKQIVNIFHFFINNYNCSRKQKIMINNFLKLIN